MSKKKPQANIQKFQQQPYPKPGAIGGRLIREVIKLLKAHQIDLPLASHIHIAVSGGIDSMALGHLLCRYGRRVGPLAQISVLHINHGWRGAESDADARFVKAAARRWGVRCAVKKLQPPTQKKGVSWEDEARQARKSIYAALEKKGGIVLTAHHADDLAETVLWRLFTGTSETHGGGIAVQIGAELRPFLGVRKELLKRYLEEEGETWREDRTNAEGRFLRSRMRGELLPVVERLFPRAVEHLARLALDAQTRLMGGQVTQAPAEALVAPALLVDAAGLRMRRSHWRFLDKRLRGSQLWRGEVHLPGGWKLSCSAAQRDKTKKRKHDPASREPVSVKWTLEKI